MNELSNVEESIDPIAVVDKLMAEAGHSEPKRWQKLLDPNVHNVESGHKRFLVNRALRLTLADAPKAAPFERFCIVDGGDNRTWEKLLKESVIPSIVEFDLPKFKT